MTPEQAGADPDRKCRRIVVLGSTGSIGEKALAAARRFPDRLKVHGLHAHRNVERLAEQAALCAPAWVAVGDPAAAARFDRSRLPAGCRFLAGEESLVRLAAIEEADLVVNAVVGAAGLAPTLTALSAGKPVALANKESIVLAGEMVMQTARRSGARVLPIDSEHSGLFQCLEGRTPAEVRRVTLTASGGPFRALSAAEMARVTPERALAHPVWPMGRRITVDSATLLNKGLEVIEAHWLFDIPLDRIGVLVHPRSVVHALVEMEDGSMLAQLAAPDMALPVQYALSWPERWGAPLPRLDLARVGPLEFEPPDLERFPCLDLACRAARSGGTAPALLNAADEVAVEAFLDGRIRFPEIAGVIEAVLATVPATAADSLDRVLEADRSARRKALEITGAGTAGAEVVS